MPGQPSTASRVPLVMLQFFTVDFRSIPHVLWRMAADRRPLHRTEGLRFSKLLGTANGRSFDPRDADLRTWGLLSVWDDAAAQQRFLERSAIQRSWSALSRDEWRVHLVPIRSSGNWSGINPFQPTAVPPTTPGPHDGCPVAAITRARLRPQRAVRFWQAVPPVTTALSMAEGRLFSVGIGEAPIGVQGTFSVWRDEQALIHFAYRNPAHRAAISATGALGWYAEDLFARFTVAHSEGSLWDRNPLEGPVDGLA